MPNKRKQHKPKWLKLIPPKTLRKRTDQKQFIANDEGRVILGQQLNYANGSLKLGRIFSYHPTKGWRSRAWQEFTPHKVFEGLSANFNK